MKFTRLVQMAILLCGVAAASEGLGGDEPQVWSKGWHWAVYNQGPGPQLVVVHQRRSDFIASLAYYNVPKVGELIEAVMLEGARSQDGNFWPDARLEVKRTETDEWREIGRSLPEGQRETLTVQPEESAASLTVRLDPFKPLLISHKFGRILLSNGAAAEFEMKHLAFRDDD